MKPITFLAASILIATATAQVQPPADRARVEGLVLTQGGEPVPRALVQLDPNVVPGPPSRSLTVAGDDTGRFVFEAVPPGLYGLSATKAGFLTGRYGQRTVTGPGKPLALGAALTTKDLTIKLTAQSTIAGQVIDQDGDPMARAQVGLLRSSYMNGRRQMAALPVQATADDRGSFRIGGLNPGRYYLSARPMTNAPALQGYATTFYPNTSDVSSAAPIDIVAGSDLTGIDVRMRREAAYSVKGVTMAGVRLVVDRLVVDRSGAGGLSGSEAPIFVNAGPNGAFELRNLRPGTYVVQIAPNATVPALARLSGQLQFTVKDSNLDGLVLQLGPPVQFSGTIKLENGDLQSLPKSPRRMGVQLVAAGVGVATPDLMVNPDGTISPQPVPADKYLWDVYALPEGIYVKSARYGNQDVTRAPLELTAGSKIEIVLATGASVISGTVRDENGQVVFGFPVTVWPKVPDPGGVTAGIMNVTTDQSGAFRIGELTPGEYYAIAWEEIDPNVARFPDFLAGFTSDAAAVKVGEGAQETVQLKLIPTEQIARELAKLPLTAFLTQDVAHALLRAVSRLISTHGFRPRQSVEAGRRQEWRRGTQECVRHVAGPPVRNAG